MFNMLKIKYTDDITNFLDSIVIVLDEKDIEQITLQKLKTFMKNHVKRSIIEDRMSYYFENFRGTIAQKLSIICEEIGLVDYEINNLFKTGENKISLACKYLGDYRNKKAIKYLLNLLPSKSENITYNVLLALAKIGDEKSFLEAFKKLSNKVLLSERSIIEIVDNFEGDKIYVYRSLMNADDDFISTIFIRAAGDYKDFTLSYDISNFLKSDNKEKRIAAVKALGNIGDNRFADMIIDLLKDQEWEVRAAAAKALGQIQDKNAIIPLVDALSDSQWYVRYNAASSLLDVEGGLEAVKIVFQKDDRFAKDMIVYVIETDFGYERLLQYEAIYSSEPKLSELIAEYIKDKMEVMA
jgi:hypothetical protein